MSAAPLGVRVNVGVAEHGCRLLKADHRPMAGLADITHDGRSDSDEPRHVRPNLSFHVEVRGARTRVYVVTSESIERTQVTAEASELLQLREVDALHLREQRCCPSVGFAHHGSPSSHDLIRSCSGSQGLVVEWLAT